MLFSPEGKHLENPDSERCTAESDSLETQFHSRFLEPRRPLYQETSQGDFHTSQVHLICSRLEPWRRS